MITQEGKDLIVQILAVVSAIWVVVVVCLYSIDLFLNGIIGPLIGAIFTPSIVAEFDLYSFGLGILWTAAIAALWKKWKSDGS